MTLTLNLIRTLLPNLDTFPLRADRMSSKTVRFVTGLTWQQNGKKRRLAEQTVASLSVQSFD
jgi:hypothetical protein